MDAKFEKEWDDSVYGGKWLLLSHDHPDYSIQQAFSEVACRTGETNADTLFQLALADYAKWGVITPRIEDALRQWSLFQAEINASPYMQYLERMRDAELDGPEALKKFLAENPWTED